jgi:MoxR-like ATPase
VARHAAPSINPSTTLQQRASEAAARLPDLLTRAEAAAAVVLAGRHPRRREGRSDTFWQFRDYAPGDPISSIDWRQSARLDRRLLVRQTEWEQPQTLLVWAGGGDGFGYQGTGPEPKRLRGQTIALAAAMMALRSGERVGILGRDEPPKAGAAAGEWAAEALLSAKPAIPRHPRLRGAISLLVSDFHDDPAALHGAFEAARSSRGQAIAVVVEDPDEAAFPFEGSRRFESPEGRSRRAFGEAASVRQDYLRARELHHEALHDAARGPNETVLFHRTDQPITPLLLQLYHLIAEASF